MPMNPVQFQAGLCLREFHHRYGTGAAMRERAVYGPLAPRLAVRALRLQAFLSDAQRHGPPALGVPDLRLPVFEHRGHSAGAHQTAPDGVVPSHVPLLTQHKSGISALALKRQLGVSYKTAWLVKHKLMQTMLQREAPRRLDERVEIDDAYLGGERAGSIHGGRGALAKSAFVAAVQTWPDGRPRFMRLSPIAGFTNETLKAWACQNLAPTAHVVSDGLQGFAQVLPKWVRRTSAM